VFLVALLVYSHFCRIVQYKDAFLKENPTYKWYNPVKHTQPVIASKPDAAVSLSTTGTNSPAAGTTNTFPLEQISAGKLAGNAT